MFRDKLLKVTDTGTANPNVDDYPGNSQNYAYDANGNMTTDGGRNLTLDYSATINLPQSVDFGNNNRIFYHYSAGGAKLIKHVAESNGTQTYTHYIGNIVYEGGTLSYIIAPEGRIVASGTGAARVFRYEYNLKDHLGNTRVTFRGSSADGVAEVMQTTSYYPFGLTMAQNNPGVATGYSKNKYLYNGKEIQDDNLNGTFFGLLDYGARFYDPAIGRFLVQDRFAEKYMDLSPYQYAANNPISNIDVNGDSIWVTVNTTITNPDGTTSITSTKYYYGRDAKGNYGFLDASGKIYSGNDKYVGQLTTALNRLQEKTVGKDLVNNLMTSSNNVEIVQRNQNKADQAGRYILWDPNNYDGAPNQNNNILRPPFIALGHEMAHIQDIWNGTFNNNPWVTVMTPGGPVIIPNAEIYSTHVENKIRKEQGLYLRVSYGMDATGNPDPSTRIIRAGTSESIYYDQNGNTTYNPVVAPTVPYSY